MTEAPVHDPRPSWPEFHAENAKTYSRRGNCTRRQVGAVIVTPDNRQVAQGYNGAPPGEDGCLTHGACPRGRHYEKRVPGNCKTGEISVCACGYTAWPCVYSVEPGSSYDTGKGACTALHAEQSAILDAGTKAISIRGCWMYVTCKPCDGCIRLMKGARLAGVRWPESELVF